MSNGGPSPFPIVVLGDSIQWGQGLRPAAPGMPSDKMAELVGAALAANPTVVSGWTGGAGLAVTVSRFAQSGATINGALGSPSPGPAPVGATTPFAGGEVPLLTVSPTILDQVRGAPGVIDPSAVRLVILDGGINDLGLFATILNPLVSPATVAAMANAACGGTVTVPGAGGFLPAGATTGRMSALLAAVGPAFPNAVIVVTGYYDILSPFSDVLGLIIAVGSLTGSLVPELLVPGGWVAGALAGNTVAATAAAGVIANCAVFTATTNAALTSAVTLANAAPGGTFSAEGQSVGRFLFVSPGISPANALFAFGSNGADEVLPTLAFLWGFNPSLDVIGALIDGSVTTGSTLGSIIGSIFGGPIGAAIGSAVGGSGGAAVAISAIIPLLTAVDEVPGARATACAASGAPPGPFGVAALGCNLASVGHPNIQGENAYVSAMTPPLVTMFGTTLPAIGILGVVQALSGCLIATAALGTSQAPEVERLRTLRDEFIAHSRLGREFFAAASAEYYAFSPIIAARMESSAEFRQRVRRFAVSPFLGFAQLLAAWSAELDDGRFRTTLAITLDASLEDLVHSGIARTRIARSADEIDKLRLAGSGSAQTPGTQARDSRGALEELVQYFNSVGRARLTDGGPHVDVLLLQPLKLYWQLLRERAGGSSLADVQTEFETGLSRWLTAMNRLAPRAGLSVMEVAADVRTIARVLGAKRPLRRVFGASLGFNR